MCIIVAKPMGVEMPDKETRERCFWANPDGAGFMLADGKNVRIRKGFMSLETFEQALEYELGGFDPTETAVVMHFRIATHGKVGPECCHPFPISCEPADLRATSSESRFGVAHNGVIQGRTTNEAWSDTMDFVTDVMYPLMRMNQSFMHSSDALELLEGACGSKLAIMDNSGEIATVGQFYEDEGVLYSNTSYLRKVYQYSDYSQLFTGAEYYRAYPDMYGWNSLDEQIEMLPYDACMDCPYNEECALEFPECSSEQMAEEAAEYYSSVKADELDAVGAE